MTTEFQAFKQQLDSLAVWIPNAFRFNLMRKIHAIFEVAYEQFIQVRSAEDNRKEHELVVLKHFLLIAMDAEREGEGSGLSQAEWEIGSAFALLHDNYAIPRITESDLLHAGNAEHRRELELRKEEQRRHHMQRGAANAIEILHEISRRLDEPIFTSAQVARCVEMISLHDVWKLKIAWPPTSDRLSVMAVEADALWPVSFPFGPLADIERKRGRPCEFTDEELRKQVEENYRAQLCAYRANFAAFGTKFADEHTFLRTEGASRILQEHLAAWKVKPH